MKEPLQHWRCLECGRLHSRTTRHEALWCDHEGNFYGGCVEPDLTPSGRTQMERLLQHYLVCYAPPWPDPLFVSDRERADEIVAEYADKGARLLVRIQADRWDDGGPR